MPKKPTPKTEPKPELTYVPEDGLPSLSLVYLSSGEWRTQEGSSSPSLLSAGTWTETEVKRYALPGDTVITLERAVLEATRGANPVVIAAIAARAR